MAADSADFAVLVYGAGAGDGLAAALVGGGEFVDETERVHHACGRPADAVHVHRHLGVLQCTGVNAQFVRMALAYARPTALAESWEPAMSCSTFF